MNDVLKALKEKKILKAQHLITKQPTAFFNIENSENNGVLEYAIKHSMTEVVRLLIKYGIDVNCRIGDENLRLYYYASRLGRESIQIAIIDAGFDIEANEIYYNSKKTTFLTRALKNKQFILAEKIIGIVSDEQLLEKDCYGISSFEYARRSIEKNRDDPIKALYLLMLNRVWKTKHMCDGEHVSNNHVKKRKVRFKL